MSIEYEEVGPSDTSVPLADVDEGAIVLIDGELFVRGCPDLVGARGICYPLSGGRIDSNHNLRCIRVELCADQRILYRRKTYEG